MVAADRDIGIDTAAEGTPPGKAAVRSSNRVVGSLPGQKRRPRSLRGESSCHNRRVRTRGRAWVDTGPQGREP